MSESALCCEVDHPRQSPIRLDNIVEESVKFLSPLRRVYSICSKLMVTFPFQFAMDPPMLFPDLYNVEISGIWENDGHGGEEEGLPKQYFVSN